MRFERSFSIPREPPSEVPLAVLKQIGPNLAGLLRIDLCSEHGKGWRKFNALCFDAPPTEDEVPLIEALVTAWAVEQMERTDVSRFRAILRRRLGVEREKKVATFRVSRAEWSWRGKRRVSAAVARRKQALEDTWAAFREADRNASAHRLRRQRRRHSEQVARIRGPFRELLSLYGLAIVTEDDAERSALTLRMQAACVEIEDGCDPILARGLADLALDAFEEIQARLFGVGDE